MLSRMFFGENNVWESQLQIRMHFKFLAMTGLRWKPSSVLAVDHSMKLSQWGVEPGALDKAIFFAR